MAKNYYPNLNNDPSIEFNINNKNLIELKNVSKVFSSGKSNVKALSDISLSIKKGECVSILGSNGAGKSTLIEVISGLLSPTSGELKYKALNERHRNKMFSIQFQKNIYPDGYKVNEIIRFHWLIPGEKNKITKETLNELMDVFSMKELEKKRALSLSGGQQQRLNILCALIQKPEIIVLDELATGLDIEIYEKALEIIKEYVQNEKITLILVSHRYSEIKSLTTRSILIENGRILKNINTKTLTNSEYKKLISSGKDKLSIPILFSKLDTNAVQKKFDKRLLKKETDFLEAKKETKNELNIIKLFKKYEKTYVLKNVNLEIKKGERISLIGPNGSGKTTLVEIISNLTKPTKGQVKYWWGSNKKIIKSKIGMQFQESLFPDNLTIREIITLFMRTSRNPVDEEDLTKMLNGFDLVKSIDNIAGSLSGGQRQKLNIIITILKQPSILILDEISTGLDVDSVDSIIKFLKDYIKKTNITFILISHNPHEIKELTDKLIVLKKGVIKKEISIKNKRINNVRDVLIENLKKTSNKKGGK